MARLLTARRSFVDGSTRSMAPSAVNAAADNTVSISAQGASFSTKMTTVSAAIHAMLIVPTATRTAISEQRGSGEPTDPGGTLVKWSS